ncbi:hypothetical protein [Adhaeribacter radiodurans]|uniref:Uncharacterized protein n=1 Tax=Adhaeribacter radiodurans TaxID=2745197 RepID=A0A7L7L5I4_9BACT|nr:hypothetical protein [Adhaeribacter radiodurans]QMU28030.1 hypothetical protein HUW48_08220 [Adhaeribacter radiodurans]
MKKNYYACWFRLDQVDQYLIWINKSNSDPEEVLLDGQGRVQVFKSELNLVKYAKTKGIKIKKEEPILHNLDAVEEWLQQPNNNINCDDCLAAWNLFTDVAYSLKLTFNGDKIGRLRNRIYDKLFWGNNDFVGDPILGHPSGQFYIPEWSPAEVCKLAKILKQGFKLFRSKLIEVKENKNFLLQELTATIFLN